jgi:hypothetical protein
VRSANSHLAFDVSGDLYTLAEFKKRPLRRRMLSLLQLVQAASALRSRVDRTVFANGRGRPYLDEVMSRPEGAGGGTPRISLVGARTISLHG